MIIEGKKAGGGSFRQTPDNLRSNDQLEALLGVCAGPVVGPTRGLKSITVDGTPIEDESGTLNFQEFTAFVADGDPAKHPQQPTLQLGGASSPVPVGLTLTNTNPSSPGPWVSKTVPNTGADALDIRIIVNQLYRQDKKGVYSTTANLEIQMKPTGTTTWINPTQGTPTGSYSETGIPLSVGGTQLTGYIPEAYFDGTGSWQVPTSQYFSIAGKTTSPYVWELRVVVPNEGPYAGVGWDVRIRLIEQESVDADPNFEKRNVAWESVAAVYTDPLGGTEAWRGLAWMYLFGRASDQLNGIPEISGPWDTKIVSVPPSLVYNPETRVYSGSIWDGSYAKAFTRDPAWIINDAISDSLWGISYVAPGSYLNKWDAIEASRWFSEQVPDGNGGTECRYSMDIAVDQPQKAAEFIQYLAGAVGAIAWDTGNGEWRIKVDKPETPVDIFTLENIEGDFNYTHSDIDTRFNDITMSFLNAEFGYREDRVRVWDQDHIDTYGRKPTTLVAVGCTGRQEAYRRAMLRLRTSINEWRTVNFVTNRRGRMVRTFDTILVADSGLGYQLPDGMESSDPPDLDLTNNRTTGRVVAFTTSGGNRITLRDSVRLEIGAVYSLSFSLPNPSYDPDSENQDRTSPTIVHTVDVVNTSGQRGDVKDIYLGTLPAAIPLESVVAISAVGLPSMPKAYRVLAVKPDDDGERVAISAIEIDSGKWDAADNVDPEAIALQLPDLITPTPLMPVSGDLVTPTLIPTDGVVDKRLVTINWRRPSSLFITGFRVGYKLNGGPMIILADNYQDTTFEMQDPVDGFYEFFVWSIDRRGQISQPLIEEIELDELDFQTNRISPGGNRIYFSQFEGDTRGWDILAVSGATSSAIAALEHQGYRALHLTYGASAIGDYVTVGTDNGYHFPVTPEERLAVQALIATSSSVGSVVMSVAWYDALGDLISVSDAATYTSAASAFNALQGYVTAPAGAITGELRFKAIANAASTAALYIARPMVSQADINQTVFPSFAPGPNADNGATKNVFRGDWETGEDYQFGDIVAFGGNSYVCINPHTSAAGLEPPNATYWGIFASGGYSAMLSNEAHIIAADADGTGYDLAEAGGKMYVYLGGQELTSGVTYSVVSPLGVTMTIDASGNYEVTSLSADNGVAILRAVHGTVTLDKVYSISKAKRGTEARSVSLVPSGQIIKYDADGAVVSGQTVNIAVQKQNVGVTAAFKLYKIHPDGLVLANQLDANGKLLAAGGGSTATDPGDALGFLYSGNAVSIDETAFSAIMTANPGCPGVTVVVQIDGLEDRVSIYSVADGQNNITGYLTNEAHAVASSADGSSPDLAGATGDFIVLQGYDEVTSGVTYSVAASFGLTININATTGVYTVSALSANSATATLRAVYNGVTIDKVFSISKSRAGDLGYGFLLTNEAHVVTTDSNGNGGDFSGAVGNVKVNTRTGDQIAAASIGTVVASGCTAQVNTAANTPVAGQPKGYYRVTAMSADNATVTIPVTYDGITVNLVFSLSKSRAGATGQNAKTISLSANRQTVTFDGSGVVTPTTQTTTFTVNRQNSTATVVWEVQNYNGTVLSPASSYITIAGDGLSATMTATQFNTARSSSKGVIVRASITDGTTISDQVSVVEVSAGSPARSMLLAVDRNGFSYDSTGVASPSGQTASIVAVKKNTTATVTWGLQDLNGVDRSLAYLTGSGDARTMTVANFEFARNGTSGVRVSATIVDEVGTTHTDYITLLRVADGAAAIGFYQDTPTPTATVVGQMWYKPTTKTWWRAAATGSGSWVQILGDLSALDSVGTYDIDPSAITQTVSQTTNVIATLGGSGLAYPNLYCIAKLNITTEGNPVHVLTEFYNQLYYLNSGSPVDFATRVAITRGVSGIPLNIITAGSPSSLSSYTGAGGVIILPTRNENVTPVAGRESLAQIWGTQMTLAQNVIDTPASGSYTYGLWMGASDANSRVVTRDRQVIRLMEVKR